MRIVFRAVVAACISFEATAAFAVEVVRALPSPPIAVGAVRRALPVTVDTAALADLRGPALVRLDSVPLGSDGTATLELRRVHPFTPSSRLEVLGSHGATPLAPPDATFFTGHVAGNPDARAVVVATATGFRATIATPTDTYRIGRDAQGRLISFALRDVDASRVTPPSLGCTNDLHRAAIARPLAPARTPSAGGGAGTTSLREVEVAIETDQELLAKFGGDTNDALLYLGELVAAANAIYEPDAGIRITASYVRLWTTTDPWTTGDTLASLDQIQAYWLDPDHDMNAIAGPHDLVHFISGKNVSGGVAYLSAACDATYHFGVSQVFGDFDVSDPDETWDIVVFTHELGHNLGSDHTHCYEPPLDKCFNGDAGCYAGPEVPSQGTIMSYCHLHAPGMANITLTFGPTVGGVLAAFADGATCLADVSDSCGNGTIEEGEDCDDGNTTSGDGCTASCRLEVCGDGLIHGAEECDDGNTVDGDGCSSACTREPLCGDGFVDDDESCDDGNTTSDDGCSAVCSLEPCLIVVPHQSLWLRTRLAITHGTSDRLVLKGEFSVANDAPIAPDTEGLSLVVDNAEGTRVIDVHLPGGTNWTTRGSRRLYRDPAGTVAGIRKATVRTRPSSGLVGVRVDVLGVGGPYPIESDDLPLMLALTLGGESAGLAGACGRRQLDSLACSERAGGRRLSCR